jgi:uncharacterized membrane protein
MDLDDLVQKASHTPQKRTPASVRLRNYFLTGIVVAAPVGITIYLTWTFVHWVDSRVKPLIPTVYNPDHYLPFSVPGVGLLFAILILTLLGFLTANFVGRSIVGIGERLLDRVPLVRNLYRGLRQLFQTALSQTSRSFQKVALVEYPTPGVWRLGFVATPAKGEIQARNLDKDLLAIFVPNTPNVTAGFLVFVPRKNVIILEMSIEDAAKTIISAGLVTPDSQQHEIEGRAPPREISQAAE